MSLVRVVVRMRKCACQALPARANEHTFKCYEAINCAMLDSPNR